MTLAVLTLVSPISLVFLFVAALITVTSAGTLWPGLAAGAVGLNVLWTGLLVMFYAPHLMQNPSIAPSVRLLWVAGFLFAAPIALTLYWLLHLTPVPHASPEEPERPHGTRTVRVLELGPGPQGAATRDEGRYPSTAE